MKNILIIILITTSGVFASDQLSVFSTEGESVSLKCSHESSGRIYYWYRQYPNRALQFLSVNTEHTIREVRLADTALYYCALRVGAGILTGLGTSTDALTFGKPISLQVNPKSDSPTLPPQLSILSGTDNGKLCLAAGFFPKVGDMSLTLEGGNSEKLNISKAALSTNSTYYYAGSSSQSIEKCEMEGVETTAKGDGKASPEENKEGQVNPTCKTPTNKTRVTTSTIDPKANAMSLIVTAVRILLAKGVAVNVMMTIKAFLV